MYYRRYLQRWEQITYLDIWDQNQRPFSSWTESHCVWVSIFEYSQYLLVQRPSVPALSSRTTIPTIPCCRGARRPQAAEKEAGAEAFECGERQRRSTITNFVSLNIEFLAA